MQIVEVNTKKVISTSNYIEKENKKLNDEFDKVSHSILVLANNWNSPARDIGIDCFNRIKKTYQDSGKSSRYEVIQTYVDSLREIVAADYVKVEDVNTKIADAYK